MTTSEQLRNEANKADNEAYESFERCDTDGFLSQWASGLTADLKRKQAEILDNGGWYEFPALYNLDGTRARAKLVHTHPPYAHYITEIQWMFFDANDKPTSKFIKAFPKRESTMTKKGYKEGFELADAEAFMNGSGYGLSGSAWVEVKRLDNGYPVDAI
jgi:hypothetical protein